MKYLLQLVLTFLFLGCEDECDDPIIKISEAKITNVFVSDTLIGLEKHHTFGIECYLAEYDRITDINRIDNDSATTFELINTSTIWPCARYATSVWADTSDLTIYPKFEGKYTLIFNDSLLTKEIIILK